VLLNSVAYIVMTLIEYEFKRTNIWPSTREK